MKNLIRQHQCEEIPKEVARQILLMHDEDMNGRLDFEEFYHLSQQHGWIFRNILVKYCKMIVPSPHRPEQDEIGKIFLHYLYLLPNHFKSKFEIKNHDKKVR